MKHIKTYEFYFSKPEEKEFESLARRLTYHLKKFFSEDNKASHKKGEYVILTDQSIHACFCDNPKTPIHVNLYGIEDREKRKRFDEKLTTIKKNYDYNPLQPYRSPSTILLTQTEAQELFIYLKNPQMFDDSIKYNL